jgi:hypothetical protein
MIFYFFFGKHKLLKILNMLNYDFKISNLIHYVKFAMLNVDNNDTYYHLTPYKYKHNFTS